MIVDHRDTVGRYVFIFDINDLTPFDGKKYIGREAEWQTHRFLEFSEEPIDTFNEMAEWLAQHTQAYRISVIGMIAPGVNAVTAAMVQVPAELAALFRLFWYD